MQSNHLALAAAFAAVTICFSAEAQHNSNDSIPPVLVEQLRENAKVESYVAEMVRVLRSADRMDDGLDADDIKFEAAERAARNRAGELGRVLRLDFDGDFRVSREEVVWSGKDKNHSRSTEATEILRRYDVNRDGVIEIQEIASVGRDRTPRGQLDDLLALDPDGDGKLSAKELRLLAQHAFETLDVDGDGELSRTEFSVIEAQRKEAVLLRNAPVCPLPSVAPGTQLILYGSNDAQALSSVAVGGSDKATTLLDVSIERGTTPLYLMLVSRQSMVWRLSGDTARVSHVVISSSSLAEGDISASGVIGLPKSKVTISRSNCPEAFGSMSYNEPDRARASIQVSLGRRPDLILSSPKAQRLSLPSGDVIRADERATPVASGFDPEMWKRAVQNWEAGVANVNPRDIIAVASIEPHGILPGKMGVAQLIGSGALVREGLDRYRLVRAIPQFPTNMDGGQPITIILAKGVSVPSGDPKYTCLISEETGEALTRYCRLPASQTTQ